MACLLLLTLLASMASAETVTVRVDFSNFDEALLQTPTSGEGYHEFEVEKGVSFLAFQEDSLKKEFPELSEFGKSPETAFAFTNSLGALFDGAYQIIGDISEEAEGNPVVYLWLGMDYMKALAETEDPEYYVYVLLDEEYTEVMETAREDASRS